MLLSAAGGCTTPQDKDEPKVSVGIIEVAEEPRWRGIVSAEDEDRLERLSDAWKAALEEAREKRFQSSVKAEGELLDPDASLPRPAPSPGPYRCRMIKLGTQEEKGAAFNAYKPFFCYVGVNEDRLALTKDSGSERPGGYLWADVDNKNRMIFLGSVALGSEKAPLPYGEDPKRDVAGIFERVEDFRFRLVLPAPRPEARLDVMELVPAV